MKPAILSLALLTLGAQAAMASTPLPQWPAGATKGDPRLQAFYDGMCAVYADRNDLAGADRDAFVKQCLGSIAKAFPVGYAAGGGGGGE